MVIRDKPHMNSRQTVRAKSAAAEPVFRRCRKLFRLQWHMFRSRNATMSIRATKHCAQALFSLFLISPSLRGVADDGKQS